MSMMVVITQQHSGNLARCLYRARSSNTVEVVCLSSAYDVSLKSNTGRAVTRTLYISDTIANFSLLRKTGSFVVSIEVMMSVDHTVEI